MAIGIDLGTINSRVFIILQIFSQESKFFCVHRMLVSDTYYLRNNTAIFQNMRESKSA